MHRNMVKKPKFRNIRRDANDATKKNKELTEDDRKAELEDSQKLTDDYIKQVEQIVNEKKKEILNV